MDIVLQYIDKYLFTPYVYPASWDEGNPVRQCISLFFITWSIGYFSYFLVAVPSYFLVFDHNRKKHPQFLKNQVRQEILQSSYSLPIMCLMTVPVYYLEVTGRTRLRDSYDDAYLGYFSIIPEIIATIVTVDFLSYTFHRAMHHKFVYKYLHKEHHRLKVPTPFASHAFNPVDGLMQQMPYHVCVVLFPVNKHLFLAILVLANIWAVCLHDGEFEIPNWMKPVINGAAHHSDHHMYFNYNFGQFFTVWDRIGGSYRIPSSFEGEGPLDYVKKQESCDTPVSAPQTDIKSCKMLTPLTKNESKMDVDNNGDVNCVKDYRKIDELHDLMCNERNSMIEKTEEIKTVSSLESFNSISFDSTQFKDFEHNDFEHSSKNEFVRKRRRSVAA